MQLKKALAPVNVTVLGIVTELNVEQPLKALVPIELILFPKETTLAPVQP